MTAPAALVSDNLDNSAWVSGRSNTATRPIQPVKPGLGALTALLRAMPKHPHRERVALASIVALDFR